jgi:chitinase
MRTAKRKYIRLILFFLITSCIQMTHAQKKSFAVFGYYAGRASMVDSFAVEKLTHLSFSFTHLKGSTNALSNAKDSAALRSCVSLKKRNPDLKVIVSMGGWTGCYSCSVVFASDSSRKIFASSTKKLLDGFNADGIDLDWEYPTIKGAPGHPYSLDDKDNFTALVKTLRDTLGNNKEISFAAGGFTSYINESVDWDKVTPLVDRINIMTYDLISGYDTITGHHSGLYSTKDQKESCDNAVKMLLAKRVPASKLLIGAAFYARIWENVAAENDGLNGKGKFLRGVSYSSFEKTFSADSGFVYHWDKTASAPYLYHPGKKWFVTFDDKRSIDLKTRYAIKKKLNGIMFWQLAEDSFTNGLLDVIDETKQKLLK